jgi:hypothetical protein
MVKLCDVEGMNNWMGRGAVASAHYTSSGVMLEQSDAAVTFCGSGASCCTV